MMRLEQPTPFLKLCYAQPCFVEHSDTSSAPHSANGAGMGAAAIAKTMGIGRASVYPALAD